MSKKHHGRTSLKIKSVTTVSIASRTITGFLRIVVMATIRTQNSSVRITMRGIGDGKVAWLGDIRVLGGARPWTWCRAGILSQSHHKIVNKKSMWDITWDNTMAVFTGHRAEVWEEDMKTLTGQGVFCSFRLLSVLFTFAVVVVVVEGLLIGRMNYKKKTAETRER